MSRDGGDDYHRGTCWYVRELAVPEADEGKEVWLKFDGAAMSTGVYLNGEHLAHHEVAFPRFA